MVPISSEGVILGSTEVPDELKTRAVWLYRESDPQLTIRKLAE